MIPNDRGASLVVVIATSAAAIWEDGSVGSDSGESGLDTAEPV